MIGLLLLINWIECDRSNFAAIAPVVYYKAKDCDRKLFYNQITQKNQSVFKFDTGGFNDKQ